MAEAAGTPGGGRDPARMAQARTQLVSVAQWLARVERSFAANAPGKELSLRWRGDRCAIATHDLGDEVGLELKIDGLALQFTEAGRPSDHEIDVEERSPAHVEAWILIELLHRGLDRDRFSKDLPYDTSALLSGDGVEFSPGEYEAELRALARLFRLAMAALGRATGEAAGEGGGEASLKIAPRDLRVEAVAKGRAIGFSLGDDAITEPHFYVEGDPAARDPAAAAAAILPASRVGSEDEVDAFLAANLAPTRH